MPTIVGFKLLCAHIVNMVILYFPRISHAYSLYIQRKVYTAKHKYILNFVNPFIRPFIALHGLLFGSTRQVNEVVLQSWYGMGSAYTLLFRNFIVYLRVFFFTDIPNGYCRYMRIHTLNRLYIIDVRMTTVAAAPDFSCFGKGTL